MARVNMMFERLNTNSGASYSHSFVAVSLTFLFHSSCFQFRMASNVMCNTKTHLIIQLVRVLFTEMVSTFTFCSQLTHLFCLCNVSPTQAQT